MPNPLYDFGDPRNPVLQQALMDWLQAQRYHAILAAYAPMNRQQVEGDFTARLPPPMPWIDPRLVQQPDPGLTFTPNVPQGNLNQSRGQYPTGTLGL